MSAKAKITPRAQRSFILHQKDAGEQQRKNAEKTPSVVSGVSGLVMYGFGSVVYCCRGMSAGHVTLKVPDMSGINIRLLDGSTQPVEPGTRPIDVARSISPRLADAAIAAKVNGDLYDLTRPLEADAELKILT